MEAGVAAEKQKQTKKNPRNWETGVKIQGNNILIHLRVEDDVKWEENTFRNAVDRWIPMLQINL